jgi:hypothetical protein
MHALFNDCREDGCTSPEPNALGDVHPLNYAILGNLTKTRKQQKELPPVAHHILVNRASDLPAGE